MGVLFFVSGQTEVAAPDFGITLDKVAHFGVFGALSTSFLRIESLRNRGWTGAVVAALLAMGFGALDELRQSFTPGRVVEVADWVADALGALTAVLLYQGWEGYRRLLEYPCSFNGLKSFFHSGTS